MTHTPGPWIATEYEIDHIIETEVLENGMQEVICFMPSGNNYDPTQTEKDNAALLAAAPDLLEACKAARKYIGEIMSKFPLGLDATPEYYLVNQIDAAIAKAEPTGEPK